MINAISKNVIFLFPVIQISIFSCSCLVETATKLRNGPTALPFASTYTHNAECANLTIEIPQYSIFLFPILRRMTQYNQPERAVPLVYESTRVNLLRHIRRMKENRNILWGKVNDRVLFEKIHIHID